MEGNREGELTTTEEEKATCWKKKEAESEREDATLLALTIRKQSQTRSVGMQLWMLDTAREWILS